MNSYQGARGLARGGLGGARRRPLHTAANVQRIFGNHQTAGYLDATHHLLRGDRRAALLSFAQGALLGDATSVSTSNSSSSTTHHSSRSTRSRSRSRHNRSPHVPRGGLAALTLNAGQTRVALAGLRRGSDVSMAKQSEGEVGLVTASFRRGSRRLTYLFAVPSAKLEGIGTPADLVQLQRSGEKVALLNTELLGSGGRTYVSRSADGARVRARVVRPRGEQGDGKIGDGKLYISVRTRGLAGERGRALVEVDRRGWGQMNVWKPRSSDGKLVKLRLDASTRGVDLSDGPRMAKVYQSLGRRVARVRPSERTNIRSYVYGYDPYDGTSAYMNPYSGGKPAGYTVERNSSTTKIHRPPSKPKLVDAITNLSNTSSDVRRQAMWQLRELADNVFYGDKAQPDFAKARPVLKQMASARSDQGSDARYTLKRIDKAQRRFSGNTFWRKLVRGLTSGSSR
jgi:hypothetical protein